jgi:hypothetical protein
MSNIKTTNLNPTKHYKTAYPLFLVGENTKRILKQGVTMSTPKFHNRGRTPGGL